MSYRAAPTDPLRDVLRQLTGKNPPSFVRGYRTGDLTEEQYERLHQWVLQVDPLGWMTGTSILEVADLLVEDAVSNGNIPPVNGALRARVMGLFRDNPPGTWLSARDVYQGVVTRGPLLAKGPTKGVVRNTLAKLWKEGLLDRELDRSSGHGPSLAYSLRDRRHNTTVWLERLKGPPLV